MGNNSMLAIDLGASNGRVIYGTIKEGKIEILEIHRFENNPVTINGVFYWDVFCLFHEIKIGMLKCKEAGLKYETIGVNSWGNTVGLLDKDGDLITNVYHYRDQNANSILRELYEKYNPITLSKETWYKHMSIQPTVYLCYLKEKKPWIFENIDKILMISDLFNYFLTGVKASERTMAATSQMLNMITKQWDGSYMKKLGIPDRLFAPLIDNGTVLGPLRKELVEELGLDYIPLVIGVAGHDTAAASGCIISDELESSLYLSCGTWSCMGCRVLAAITEEKLFNIGITNDLGLFDEMQLRFNHTGLWILQECKKDWESNGIYLEWEEITDLILKAPPFLASIDTEAEEFFNLGNMPQKVQEFCKKTKQKIPTTVGEIGRIILESLAFRYRFSRDRLQECAGYEFKTLQIISGGSRNRILCQFTANILNIPVVAGMEEAAVMSNLVQQAIAYDVIKDMKEGQELMEKSCSKQFYKPQDSEIWNDKYDFWQNYISSRYQRGYRKGKSGNE